MTHRAFIVGLPIDAAATARPVVPARFALEDAGPCWVVYSDALPVMVPNGRGTVQGSPRRSDARAALQLYPLAVHESSMRGAFIAGSRSVSFLRWAYDKAAAAGYATWTIAEFRTDAGASAEWVRAQIAASEPTLTTILAGFDAAAMEPTTRAEIDGASPLEE